MRTISLSIILLLSTTVFSQTNSKKTDTTKQKPELLKEVVVLGNALLGSKFEARNKAGSASYISQEDLKKFSYTNINRVLQAVPGINIYEEDGFGLRPNISFRGTSPERSAKINLMEDGILIAPAPYSAPAAYYFPTIGRMEAIEVLKGSSQIQYGPNTSGGAINMISTQIPNKFTGRASIAAGNYDSRNTEVVVGNSYKNFGFVSDYFNYSSDGFKNIDGGGNTGFDKSDYSAKFRLNTNFDAKTYQSLTFKIQYSEEEANETYLGLTDDDFENTPFRRYKASAEDVMNAEHQQYQLNHFISVSPSIDIRTTGYINKFKRNWYKLDDVNLGERVSISNILSSPESFPSEYQTLLGNDDSQPDVLGIKANNRAYTSKGIQSVATIKWGNNWLQSLEAGIRYHEDDEDRFQWVDRYAFRNKELIRTTVARKGSNSNRISSAEALAAHLLYSLKIENLTLTPGLRYENITLTRMDYGTDDPRRIGQDLSTRENSVDVWIPGIGANYRFNDNLSLFGGVHKGFSPPSNTPGQDAEESINYELGTRFNFNGIQGELVGFYNDYKNLLGSDLAATGGTGSLDQFNAGEVRVSGIEFLVNYNLLRNKTEKFRMPISFSYTLTDTEFLTSFDSNEDIYGVVTVGDEIPYIAKHQLNATIEFQHKKFDINLNSRYTGAFRTKAGSGSIPEELKVDSNVVVDVSARYYLDNNFTLSTNIINLFNTSYAVSRVPAGLRPGQPFGFNISMSYDF